MNIRPSLVVAVFFFVACAGGPATQAATAPDSPSPGLSKDPNLITRADLSDPSLAGIDLLQAIRRTHPSFLTVRGTVSKSNSAAGAVQVSVDGGALQATSTLGSIRVEEVLEIRYYNTSEAAQKFGSSAASGPVLAVRRR